jgi:hypothetical protein
VLTTRRLNHQTTRPPKTIHNAEHNILITVLLVSSCGLNIINEFLNTDSRTLLFNDSVSIADVIYRRMIWVGDLVSR